MDSNGKRRGLMKLMRPSFYGAVKLSPTAPYATKIMPKQSTPTSASVGYLINQEATYKVSYIAPADDSGGSISQHESYFGAIADERVNMKAANYISCVRERFRLERSNSERKHSQE